MLDEVSIVSGIRPEKAGSGTGNPHSRSLFRYEREHRRPVRPLAANVGKSPGSSGRALRRGRASPLHPRPTRPRSARTRRSSRRSSRVRVVARPARDGNQPPPHRQPRAWPISPRRGSAHHASPGGSPVGPPQNGRRPPPGSRSAPPASRARPVADLPSTLDRPAGHARPEIRPDVPPDRQRPEPIPARSDGLESRSPSKHQTAVLALPSTWKRFAQLGRGLPTRGGSRAASTAVRADMASDADIRPRPPGSMLAEAKCHGHREKNLGRVAASSRRVFRTNGASRPTPHIRVRTSWSRM
jgi:hypothetical protein